MNACPQKAISYEFRFNMKKEKCGCGRKEPKTAFGRVITEISEPAQLFRFAAFTFGMIMSSDFVDRSMKIVFDAIKGAF